MANIHIPIRHQSAPNLRHDGILAREAAAAAGKAEGTDWDAIDWAALHPEVVRRRRMVNQDFDREFDSPGHHDPQLGVLEQRAHLEKIELRPAAWVEDSLELYELNCEKARSQHLPGQVHWGGDRRMRTGAHRESAHGSHPPPQRGDGTAARRGRRRPH
jgi:hypothetical protein